MKARALVEGLAFGEGLRWREGRFWHSDFYKRHVRSVTPEGETRVELEIDDQPSGLGWLPDGRLLVAAMKSRKILRREHDGRIAVHADLAAFTDSHINDMLVDANGNAFVGCFGFDLFAFEQQHGQAALFGYPGPPKAPLFLVRPNGETSIASRDHEFPNGMAMAGGALILAECFMPGFTAFDLAPDGALTNRRRWAVFPKAPPRLVPDGICADSEGAIWFANALGAEAVRVSEGGEILDRVETSQTAFACALGGPDGRDLLIATAPTSRPDAAAANPRGRLEIARVSVPA
ncbi:MAG: SMP-30/gluconolactonase/LRE family protein [Hyphomonadaceae bacterium]